jgi:hypothetical protein
MSNNLTVIIVWSLMVGLSLVGAGFGWWYGTVSFYFREVGAVYFPGEMGWSRRVKRHLARVFWTVMGAVGGALVAMGLLMAFAR